MAHHKSMAVQHLLLTNPRKAREVAILLLLGASDYVSPVNVSRHDCLSSFAQADEPPASYQGVEQQAKQLATALGLVEDDEERAGWMLLRCSGRDATTLYEAVKALSDEDLDRLHLLLTVLAFGQGNINRLDTTDTLFNRVAQDLGADMRACWRPDMAFLSRRTREQLMQIAAESGYTARSGYPAQLKKSELVTALVRHFAWAQHPDNTSDSALKARDWLPDAMRFPAVDPAAPVDAEDDSADDETGQDALAA
jgi:ParB family chromosome partitioning protein